MKALRICTAVFLIGLLLCNNCKPSLRHLYFQQKSTGNTTVWQESSAISDAVLWSLASTNNYLHEQLTFTNFSAKLIVVACPKEGIAFLPKLFCSSFYGGDSFHHSSPLIYILIRVLLI
jgi:hypothetical protein